ncbi:MAG: hypothetical protein AAGA60_29235 [Cyanobacteria bacterium P01_E01_bin.42]
MNADLNQTLSEIGNDIKTQIIAHVGFNSIRVIINSANQTEFSISTEDLDLKQTFEAISTSLKVAAIVWRLDGDLAEAHDNAFRTQPNQTDVWMVEAFIKKYPETRDALAHLETNQSMKSSTADRNEETKRPTVSRNRMKWQMRLVEDDD